MVTHPEVGDGVPTATDWSRGADLADTDQ